MNKMKLKWIRKVAGTILTQLAQAVVGDAPEELTPEQSDELTELLEDEDAEEVPHQAPLTPAARSLMWRPKVPPPQQPASHPLAGSVQARVQASRHSS